MTFQGAVLSLPAVEDLKGKETVATFITKVWKIVQNPEYNKYIHWSDVSELSVLVQATQYFISEWEDFHRVRLL